MIPFSPKYHIPKGLSLALALLVCLIWIAGCGLVDNNKVKRENVLMPLAVGNSWTYEIIRPGWPDPHQGTIRETVTKQLDITVNGEIQTVWAWNSEIDTGESAEYYWLSRNGDAGLYSMGGLSESDTLLYNTLAFKYPANIGDEWDYPKTSFSLSNSEFYISDTLRVTLVDKDREIETPSGKYKCHVYYFRTRISDDVLGHYGYYQFYKPGIGLIAQEEWVEHPSGNTEEDRLISKISLINYHLVQ